MNIDLKFIIKMLLTTCYMDSKIWTCIDEQGCSGLPGYPFLEDGHILQLKCTWYKGKKSCDSWCMKINDVGSYNAWEKRISNVLMIVRAHKT